MLVRPARPEEWRALRALRLRALEEDPRAFGRTLDEERAQPEAEWRERAFGPRNAIFVAERAGALVAMCGLHVEDDGALQLWGMWTAPEARGAGVGRALVDAALAEARARGAARVHLWVNLQQAGAMRLYERAGFERDGAPIQGTRDTTRTYQRMQARV
ncbi:MAG TPA: GNAT family N-acetyltransferase [Candidatus Thermoplasmatota archaeon]|nr:GNAT family N-acetyltransferase [Candidatus Thermoplasmatota archaeon]